MISVFGSDFSQTEISQVINAINEQWVGSGPRVERFEGLLAERLGMDDVAVVDSGSSALLLAVRLLDLPPGSEVILPSLTWVACAHAVVLAGCQPVLCDVDLETCNVDERSVEERLSDRTAAVMVVHYAGLPVDMAPILQFGHPVIEDAAHAIDSAADGVHCGTSGAAGIFSFDSVKNLATCDAGAVIGSPELVRRAKELRYCGVRRSGFKAAPERARWWEHDIAAAFPRVIANDIAAALGIAQLERLDALQARRKAIWDMYDDAFAAADWISRPPGIPDGVRHSFFTYLIRVPAGSRDGLARHLFDSGVYTTLRYHPLHMTDFYRTSYPLPNTERIAVEGLNLPLHPRLTESDVQRVIDLVLGYKPGVRAARARAGPR
jgi:dTDP-4-amino-4,6-dideoxygalactose transaminase